MMLLPSDASGHPSYAEVATRAQYGSDGRIREIFDEGDDAYADFLKRIANASQRIWLESYIYAADEVGWQLARALAEKATQGLDVRLMVDSFGGRGPGMESLANFLLASGVQWKWFHPWTWRSVFRYNVRNHCKLWIVDDDTAYLGGFNIHRQSSKRYFGTRRWRDTQVRVGVPLVEPLAWSFQTRWRGQKWDIAGRCVVGGQILLSGPSLDCHRQLRCATTHWLDSARQRLWITTPYLVPDRGIMRRLKRAAKRGVDVRLLVPLQSDVRIVDWAARYAARILTRHGVQIQFYRPRFLRAKTMLKDGDSVWVGSANLDYRSLWKNFELNLIALDPRANVRFSEHFVSDWKSSTALLETVSWKQRLVQRAAWHLRRWL